MDHLGERPELHVLFERARAAGQDLRALGQRRQELLDDPGLADAGLPQQRDEVCAFSRCRSLEDIGQQRDLAPPVHERDPSPVDDAPAHALDGPRHHRTVEPLRLDGAGLAVGHRLGGELHGRIAREDLAGGGGLLQAGAEVHLRADHDVAVVGRADRDLAGAHPDPHAHRGRQAQLGREVLGVRPDLERGPDRAHGVVLARRGDPEHDEHGVADEPFRDAAVPGRLLRHHPVERRKHLAEAFRVEPSGEFGRAGHVDEDDRDQPPFGRRRHRHRRAAVRTEVGAGRQRLPAARAALSAHRCTR